jgi:hypothetical protein
MSLESFVRFIKITITRIIRTVKRAYGKVRRHWRITDSLMANENSGRWRMRRMYWDLLVCGGTTGSGWFSHVAMRKDA